MPSIAQWIVWIMVGLLGGSLAGLIVRFDRQGFGYGRNLGLGLVGALVGGLLFRVFGLFPQLEQNRHLAPGYRGGGRRVFSGDRGSLGVAAMAPSIARRARLSHDASLRGAADAGGFVTPNDKQK